MIDIAKTASNPKTFLRLYGINYGAFLILQGKAEKYIQQQKQLQPLSRRGKKSTISVSMQLLLLMVYLRQYTTFLSLGSQFGISESYAYKRYTYMRKVLVKVMDMPDGNTLSFESLTNAVAMDVSEQTIEMPLKNQKQYYSGKKKDIL